jgi:A/G-specific adenine glycosylase
MSLSSFCQENRMEFTVENFTRPLLRYYDAHRRILPWREDPTPYHVWLSEIMLQQTRVEAVRSYYTRFLTVLPTIRALAEAPEDQYLKLWEGLGYYSRVRNLHKAAAVIMETYGGEMPRTAKELLTLPGIGAYTSAAIASIAFWEAIPAIDGNLLRIFARLTLYEGNIKENAARKAAEDMYRPLMTERPGDFNQALMDLGATVCLPNAAPHCESCPFHSVCEAHRRGCEQAYPKVPEKKARRQEKYTVFLIRDAGKLLLHKRPDKGLLAGLYEFPNAAGHLTQEEALQYVRAFGFAPLRILPLPEAKHVFSHVEWHMTGYFVMVDELHPFPEKSALFPVGLKEIQNVYSIPSAFAAYRKAIYGIDEEAR